jgi:hypothetical protein
VARVRRRAKRTGAYSYKIQGEHSSQEGGWQEDVAVESQDGTGDHQRLSPKEETGEFRRSQAVYSGT